LIGAIQVQGLETHPILMLKVSRPAAVDRALQIAGQTEVETFHVTLARLDNLALQLGSNVRLPAPPSALRLSGDIRLVDTGIKRSCYVEVDGQGQEQLRSYIASCELALGVSLGCESRVFHVTLTNAGGGGVRSSVGAVWEYPSIVL